MLFYKIKYAHTGLECLLRMLPALENNPYYLGNIISDRLAPFYKTFGAPLGVISMLWRRFLKRRNCAPNTVKYYMHAVKSFVIWLDVPLESVTHRTISCYIDYLMRKRLKPKTIN